MFDGDRVLRVLDERGLSAWAALEKSGFFREAVDAGRLIPTDPTTLDGETVLEHPRIPFISYPFEWTFSMLRDAALLQLDLLAEALGSGFTLKDATPYNIQFLDGKPLFIDIGSFEPYVDGEPWIGYRQFTRQFLFPLFLSAWTGVPFQPWLRGNPEGPTAADMKRILGAGKRMKPAAMMHVSLQARMEERMSGEAIRGDLKSAGFNAEMILANVTKLKKLVSGLESEGAGVGWVDYESCDHVGRDRDTKTKFLADAMERHRPARVLDLGANDGHFSEFAAQSGSTAVAVDGDEQVLDALYRRGSPVSIVVSDLTNPSPSQGWAGVERPSLMERANPELVIAYGLIHHLVYTASVPPGEVMRWLASLGAPVVVEFVAPEDPMVARLTANKTDDELHSGRTRAAFEETARDFFDVRNTLELDRGNRVLYALDPIKG